MFKILRFLLYVTILLFPLLIKAQGPPDGDYDFAGAQPDGLNYKTADNFFIISGHNGSGTSSGNISADGFGAYINDGSTTSSGTSYIEVSVNGGGSFQITNAVIGDYNESFSGSDNNFTNVYAVGLANGVQVAITPAHNSPTYEANYALNFSDFAGKSINAFRVYYSWGFGTSQAAFNLESISIQGASEDPPAATVPTVTTTAATSVTTTTATVNATVNDNGAATTAQFRLHTSESTVSNGSGGDVQTATPTVSAGAGSTAVSYNYTTLSPGNTYYYRAEATNSAGTTNGTVLHFTTLPTPPTIAAATSVSSTGFTINWSASAAWLVNGYRLDVATDASFTDILSSYNNLYISGKATVSQTVTGLTPGTQYWYRLRAENDGGISTNSGSGTQTTLPPPVAGFGNALDFDGSNDYVSVPDHTSLKPTAGITLAAWINTRGSGGFQFIMGKEGNNENQWHYLLSLDNTRHIHGRFYVNPAANKWHDYTTAAAVPLNTWTHVATTYDNSSVRVYINGILSQTFIWNEPLNPGAGSTPLTIGIRGDGQFPFNGQIDETQVWNRALSDSEIQASMFRNTVTTGLAGYWKFNESSGTNIADSSPIGNNGTMINMNDADHITSTVSDFTVASVATHTGILAGTDMGGNALTWSIVTNGSKGTATITNASTGAFSYTPSPNANGSDSFTFKVNNGSGDSNTATVNVTIQPGPVAGFKNALSFNGTTDRVTAVATPGNLGTGDFAITAWFKTTGSGAIISNRTEPNADDNYFTLAVSSGKIWVEFDGGAPGGGDYHSRETANLGLSDNKWHHVVLQRNGTDYIIFVDGVERLNSTIAGTLDLTSGNNLIIGGRYNGGTFAQPFPGQIDEISVWNRVLTPTERTTSMYKTFNGNESGLVALWKFDEGNGTTAYDNSTNGYNGTITGASYTVSTIRDFTTDEDIAYSGILPGSKMGGSALTYSVVTNGTKGSVSITNVATGAFTYTPTLNENSSDSFTFKVNDGSNDSAPATVNVSITAINDVPELTASSGTTNFTEGGAQIAIDAGITLTDVDNTTLSSATVSITGNFQSGQDVLAFVNDGSTMGNINGSYNPLIGYLSLSSSGASATTTQWQNALRAVTYTNTSENPNTSDRTISFLVNDGTANSNMVTKTLTVTTVNDPPTVTATAGTPTFTENGSAVSLFSAASVSTIESGQQIISLSLSVSSVGNGSDELLNADGTDISLVNSSSGTTATNGLSYSVSVAGGIATVTLEKAGGISSSAAASLINGLTYKNNSDSPSGSSRVVTLVSIQDNGGTANGGTDNTSLSIAAAVTINAVNDAPTLSGGPYSLTGINTNGTSAGVLVSTILGGLTYADVDDSALSGIAVTATSGSGTWEYSTDNTTWMGVGTVSSGAALLLSSSTYIRYKEPPGEETASLTFAGWDQTFSIASSNSTRQTANAAVSGGSTAFSSGTATASLIVAPSTNANLSTLVLNTGTLSPLFSSSTTNYAVHVGNSTSSVTVTPTVAEVSASVKVNSQTVSSGSASNPASLSIGEYTTITTTVTAEDGTTTKTYTINVYREGPKPGNALAFAGTPSPINSVSVPNTGNKLDIGSNTITIEAWIKPHRKTDPAHEGSGNNWNTILMKGHYGYGLVIGDDNCQPTSIGKLGYWGQNACSNVPFSTKMINYDRWNHVAVSINNGALTFYVNGEIAGTASGVSVPDGGPGSLLYLGVQDGPSSGGNGVFYGDMDEVRIWSAARSDAEIKNNMYDEVSPSASGLVAYYRFEEGPGNGANTGKTTLFDATGNELNGTLNNFTLSGSASNWVESYAMVVPQLNDATGLSTSGFTANWSVPVIGTVTNYLIDISASSDFSSFITGYNGKNVGTAVSETVSGLSSGTTYYYRVRADKTSVTGTGGNPPARSLTTNTSVSSITRTGGVAALTNSTNISFTVTFANSVTGVDAADFTLSPTGSASGTAGTPAGSGTTWTVPVTGVSGDGTLRLDFTAPTGVMPNASNFTGGETYSIDHTAPAVPTGLAATAGNTQNILSWDANGESDLASYNFYGGTTSSPGTLLINTTSTSYTHTGLTNGTTYYYRISAVDNAGNESTISTDVSAVPQAPQTITFNTLAAKAYGAADFDPGETTSASGLTVTYQSSNTSVATIVAGKIHIIGAGTTTITASQAGNSSYLAAPDETQNLIVLKKDITVSLNAAPAISKAYNGSDAAALAGGNYSLNGIETDDVVTVSGTASYDDKNTGTGKTITVNSFVLAGADKDNYNLTTTSATTTGDITQKGITVSLNATPAISKEYNGSDAAALAAGNYSLSGIETGDMVTVSGTASYDDKNAGTGKVVTAASFVLDGAQKDNYSVSTASATTTGTITAKPLTAALAGTVTKPYDGNVSATLTPANYSALNGTIGSDDVDYASKPTSGTYNNNTVATGKTVTIAGLSLAGADAGNYTFASTLSGNVGTITAKPLTASLTGNVTKTYDGTTSATLAASNYLLAGIVSGDAVNLNNPTSGNYTDKNTGSGKTVTVSSLTLSGADAANYMLVSTSANAPLGTITPKALTITAENKTRVQGLENPTFTVSYSGFVSGETNAVLITQPALSTTATLASPQGDYPISVSGATADNYTINHINGTLTVTPGQPTSLSFAAVTLPENRPAGTPAGTFSSTSDDPAAIFTYSLVSGAGSTDNSSFTISGNQLLTAATFDYESKMSFAVLVRTTSQYGLYLDRQFTIALTDVNETPTLAAIANQILCITSASQTVLLSGITAGPETGQSVSLSVSSDNPAMFTSLAIGPVAGGNAPLIYQLASDALGITTITVTINDDGGTSNGGINSFSRTFTITSNSLPVGSISSDIGNEINKGLTAQLTASGGILYTWANAPGIISGQNSAILTVRPEVTTTYTVTIENASGCTAIQSITINVLDNTVTVEANNVMSPDGDGVNDNLIIKNLDMHPNNTVKIFDRAGRLLYEKKNYTDEWDGTFQGSPLAEDTYYYIVDFGPGKGALKGFVSIIRKR